MSDWTRRALAYPELATELYRRGMFDSEEKQEILRVHPDAARARSPLGPISFATLLASADSQLAARAVVRNLVNPFELVWLERTLRY